MFCICVVAGTYIIIQPTFISKSYTHYIITSIEFHILYLCCNYIITIGNDKKIQVN